MTTAEHKLSRSNDKALGAYVEELRNTSDGILQ